MTLKLSTKKKPVTNEKFVKDLMTDNPTGALCQMFVLEAIRKYAVACAAWTDEQVEEFQKTNHFISMEGWRTCARHIKSEFETRK